MTVGELQTCCPLCVPRGMRPAVLGSSWNLGIADFPAHSCSCFVDRALLFLTDVLDLTPLTPSLTHPFSLPIKPPANLTFLDILCLLINNSFGRSIGQFIIMALSFQKGKPCLGFVFTSIHICSREILDDDFPLFHTISDENEL